MTVNCCYSSLPHLRLTWMVNHSGRGRSEGRRERRARARSGGWVEQRERERWRDSSHGLVSPDALSRLTKNLQRFCLVRLIFSCKITPHVLLLILSLSLPSHLPYTGQHNTARPSMFPLLPHYIANGHPPLPVTSFQLIQRVTSIAHSSIFIIAA